MQSIAIEKLAEIVERCAAILGCTSDAALVAACETEHGLRCEAEAEIEAIHRYLDESYVNDPESEPLSLMERVVNLVKDFENGHR